MLEMTARQSDPCGVFGFKFYGDEIIQNKNSNGL